MVSEGCSSIKQTIYEYVALKMHEDVRVLRTRVSRRRRPVQTRHATEMRWPRNASWRPNAMCVDYVWHSIALFDATESRRSIGNVHQKRTREMGDGDFERGHTIERSLHSCNGNYENCPFRFAVAHFPNITASFRCKNILRLFSM